MCLDLECSSYLLTRPKPVCPRALAVNRPVPKGCSPIAPCILCDCCHISNGHTEFSPLDPDPGCPSTLPCGPASPANAVPVQGGHRIRGAEVPHQAIGRG